MVLFFGNNGDFAWSWELVRQLLVENASCWSYYWWTIECFSACSLSDSLLSSLPPWVLYVFVALFWSALTVSSFLSFCCVCFASLYVRPKTCFWDCLLQVDGDNPWLMSDHSGRVWQGCPIFWKQSDVELSPSTTTTSDVGYFWNENHNCATVSSDCREPPLFSRTEDQQT